MTLNSNLSSVVRRITILENIVAIKALQQGELIAYPTEAVWGLGCDPFNEQAVLNLLALKQRPLSKGLIVIGSSWEQLRALTAAIPSQQLHAVLASWPGPSTWVFPAAKDLPRWLSGDHPSVALRVTAHPVAKALCEAFGPLVSTSANVSGDIPALTEQGVEAQFGAQISVLVSGALGGLDKPTQIREALTGQVLRE